MIQLQFKDLIDLSNAKILVYNHVGQVVRTFSDVPKGKIQNLELQWDGRSDGGAEVPAGMYIFRLQTPTGAVQPEVDEAGALKFTQSDVFSPHVAD